MLYSFNINLPKAAVCTRAYQETEDFMKRIFRHFISAIVSMTILLGAALSFNMTVSANPSIGNGIILSDDVVALSEGTSFTIAAALGEGLDASRLTCVSANPGVATVTPVASMANIANFQIDYAGNGSTVIAIVHMDNPAVVAYATVNASPLVMQIPARLGTNHDNYCVLTGYEFKPYELNKYVDFGVYKNTLKLTYRLEAVGDSDYTSWGCYGYFYDAMGNILSKVHLYCGSSAASGQSLGPLGAGQIYTSEFNVPVNAVSFSIEGF